MKNFSISCNVLYIYVLNLTLHHIFNDLCNGYAQCHQVRMHIFLEEKNSQILLKFGSLLSMNEKVPIRFMLFVFHINFIFLFLLLNHLHKKFVKTFSYS